MVPSWALVLASLGLWLAAVGFRWADRLRLRGIPLVRPMPFLLGHLWCFLREPMYLCYERWTKEYGPIFLVFFGKNPTVVISDPDLIRQVALKRFAAFHDRPAFVSVPKGTNKRLTAIRSGLLVARGGYWGSLRAAMNPLFHTAALQSYGGMMNDCVSRFLGRLQEASQGGQQPLDIHALLGRMTLEVIGRSAFGVELKSDSSTAEADQAAGRPNLVGAIKIIFSSNAIAPGQQSVGMLFRILPDWAEPLLFNLFFTFVGTLAKRLEYARSTLLATADQLMQAAKKAALARGERVQMVETDWRWWPESFADQTGYKGVTPAPNSAIDMLMQATNKETGQGLKDVQIAAQCNTLIAAGYETTANALSFAIYCLARHPAAEAALLAEVDAFGGGEPGPEDATRFPYVEAVINEALRLFPPAHVTTRECTAPGGCTLVAADGRQYHIPAKTWVHVPIWTLHHSPEHWPDPYAFRPERFLDPAEAAGRHPHAFLPFGLGPRNCIGFRFALQARTEGEMRIALVRFYQRYTFRLAPSQASEPLPLKQGITLAPKEGLWVVALPRARGAAAGAAGAAEA